MKLSSNDLRYVVGFQGVYTLATSLWGLLGTRHFLSLANPSGDLFEARSFAALSIVVSLFFIAGCARKDLLKPASFLGLGCAVAIALVQLFHLPAIGWTLLWIDLLVEIALAAIYVAIFFFLRDEPTPAIETPTEPLPAEGTPKVAELPDEEVLEQLATPLDEKGEVDTRPQE